MDSFCGQLLWTAFVDSFCGQLLWTAFVDSFCGQNLWTAFVDSLDTSTVVFPTGDYFDRSSSATLWKDLPEGKICRRISARGVKVTNHLQYVGGYLNTQHGAALHTSSYCKKENVASH